MHLAEKRAGVERDNNNDNNNKIITIIIIVLIMISILITTMIITVTSLEPKGGPLVFIKPKNYYCRASDRQISQII